MKPFYKNLALWLVVGLAMTLLFSLFKQSRVDDREINYTEFMGQVEKGLVAGVVIQGQEISGTDPIHKVTIIPRGRSLGLTQQLPIDEKHTYPKKYLLNNLAVLMGGRAAEELVLDQTTIGAGNDIERVTETACKMVCEWGMSERLGPLTFGQAESDIDAIIEPDVPATKF